MCADMRPVLHPADDTDFATPSYRAAERLEATCAINVVMPQSHTQLALDTLHAALRQLETSARRLEELAVEDIGAFALPPYFRSAAAIVAAAEEGQVQAATIEELLRRARKNR
jgi:hypothetical protein